MQKQFLLTLLAFFVFQIGFAQTLDVFKNRSYEISSHILKETFNKDYVPADVKIHQDKLKNGNKQWQKIEADLKKIAISSVENAVSFFEINAVIKKQLNIAKEILINNREKYEYAEPVFQNLNIKLLSVVNDFAIYSLEYNFEAANLSDSRTYIKLFTRHFYSANINTGTLENIDIKPNAEQQKILASLTNSQFQKLYLLQTEKLELNDVEKIQNPSLIDTSFAKIINYSEAVIFPYTSGLMIEFPAYTKTSKILDGKSFRLLLKDEELEGLLTQFPKLKKYFTQNLKLPSKTTKERLADEQMNMDKFKYGPEKLQVLKLFDFGKKIYEMKIEQFQLFNTEKQFTSSQTFRFNEDQNLDLIESRGSNREIGQEEKFTYNSFQELESVTETGYKKNLTLYYYKDKELSYSEKIELEKYENPYNSSNQNDLKIRQHHFVYNGNYRYDILFYAVGDISEHIYGRHNSENTTCGNNHCIIYDNEDRIIGVKVMQGGSIEILTDAEGKILESYFDNDRHHYYFSYDAENRIKDIVYRENGTVKNTYNYQYHESPTSPLSILKKDENTTEYIYSIKFWD